MAQSKVLSLIQRLKKYHKIKQIYNKKYLFVFGERVDYADTSKKMTKNK